jgi:hypothetical protein
MVLMCPLWFFSLCGGTEAEPPKGALSMYFPSFQHTAFVLLLKNLGLTAISRSVVLASEVFCCALLPGFLRRASPLFFASPKGPTLVGVEEGLKKPSFLSGLRSTAIRQIPDLSLESPPAHFLGRSSGCLQVDL